MIIMEIPMEDAIWEWHSDNPKTAGFYAILFCYDPDEGTFPDSRFWDGKEWDESLPIVWVSSIAFPTKEDAEDWAYENDPGY